ncbi:MAG: ABC transporter permease subunit [Hymenobacter sp.]
MFVFRAVGGGAAAGGGRGGLRGLPAAAGADGAGAGGAGGPSGCGQGEKHPHIATPLRHVRVQAQTGLSFFDYGLDAYTGTSVYLEAHYQHEFMFRPAQDYSALIRFGELSGALVLQVLLPLLVIFLCFGAITRERESGTLRLVLSQGVSRAAAGLGQGAGLLRAWCWRCCCPRWRWRGRAFGRRARHGTGRAVAGRLAGAGGWCTRRYFFGFVCLCVLVSALGQRPRATRCSRCSPSG